MQKKTYLLLFVLLVLLFGIINQYNASPLQKMHLWDITQQPGGYTEVFSIQLEKTSLDQAEQRLYKTSRLALITEKIPMQKKPASHPKSSANLEAYFGELTLGGISGHMIATLKAPEEFINRLLEKNTQKKILASGSVSRDLSRIEQQHARKLSIESLSFIPYARLNAEILQRLFGAPTDILSEADTSQHYLYPEKGLEITLHATDHDVLQYVNPYRFEELILLPLQLSERIQHKQ